MDMGSLTCRRGANAFKGAVEWNEEVVGVAERRAVSVVGHTQHQEVARLSRSYIHGMDL